MGAWGPGIFENDSAVDWTDELVEGDVLQAITSALSVDKHDYLEFDECAHALCAAELVACFLGHPSSQLPEELSEWAKVHSDRRLAERSVSFAIKAVQRVKTDSELCEVWSEHDGFEEWQGVLDGLLARLRGHRGPNRKHEVKC